MSATAPKQRPGPTAAADLTPISSDEEVEEKKMSRESHLHSRRSEFLTVEAAYVDQERRISEASSVESDESESPQELTVMRRESIKKFKERDINDLYKELEAEMRFLKTSDDMNKIKIDLKKIKDAGGHVVNLSAKVEGLMSALKTAAKDKFSQEKEMLELRNEISELKERHNTMEEIIHFQSPGRGSGAESMRSEYSSGISILFDEKSAGEGLFHVHNPGACLGGERSASPALSAASFKTDLSVRSTPAFSKMKEQEALMASLHRKIDFLELQNKDKEVDTLKDQVNTLSETIEKLIGGMQDVSKRNPHIVAQLDSLKKTLPNAKSNTFRNECSLPLPLKPRMRASSVPLGGRHNQRHLWVSRLKESDFKEGPVSFVL